MKTTTDHDENGIAERQEQLVQQRMSAMLMTLSLARKQGSSDGGGYRYLFPPQNQPK